MKIKRIVSLFLVLVLALSAVAVLGSCKKSEKGITVQIGPNPETLDPALNSAVDGGNMLITLFETLLIIDQDNKVQPGQPFEASSLPRYGYLNTLGFVSGSLSPDSFGVASLNLNIKGNI